MNGLLTLDDAFYLHAALTLLHFLWQGLLLAAIACLAGWCLQNRSAATRYRIYTVALILMLACLPATLLLLRQQEDAATNALVLNQHAPIRPVDVAQPAETSLTTSDAGSPLDLSPVSTETVGSDASPQLSNVQPHATAISPNTATAPSPTHQTNSAIPKATSLAASADPTSTVEQITRWTLAVYLLGVSLMFSRTLLGLSGTRRLRRDAQALTDAAFIEAVRRRARQFNLRSAPVVAYCNRVAVPALVGLWRPMILLPTVLATGLTPEQLELVVVHELAHIRRWDNAWLILQRTIESILFFHPAVWYISRRMSIERELCCDEMVVATAARPSQYAESLLRVVELTAHTPVPIPSGATMTSPRDGSTFLVQRLMRILGEAKTSPVRLPRLWPSVLVTLLVILAVSLVRVSMHDEPELVAAEAVEEEQSPETEGENDTETPLEERERRIACKTPFMVLPESGCIELIGVTEYPDEEASAWRPNGEALGSPLTAIDTAHVTDIEVPEGKIARRFRFNIRLGTLGGADLTCSIKGMPLSAANHFEIGGLSGRSEQVWDTVFLLPPERETVDLALKASGIWRRFHLGYTEAQPVPIEGPEGAEVHVTLSMRLSSYERVRAVVTTPDGRKVVATADLGRSRNGRTPVVFRFPGMSVEQVQDYHLERREEGTITFYNVSVERAHRSDVAIGVLPVHFYWAMNTASFFHGFLGKSQSQLEQSLWAEHNSPGTYDAIEIAEYRRQRDQWEYGMRQVSAIAAFFVLGKTPIPAVISFATDDVTAPEKSLARLIAHHEIYRRHAERLDADDRQWRSHRKSLMSRQVDPSEVGVGWHAQFFTPARETNPPMGRVEKALLAELDADQDEIFMRSPTGSVRYLQRIRAEKSCVNMCHLSTRGEIFLEPPDGDRLEPGDVLAIPRRGNHARAAQVCQSQSERRLPAD